MSDGPYSRRSGRRVPPPVPDPWEDGNEYSYLNPASDSRRSSRDDDGFDSHDVHGSPRLSRRRAATFNIDNDNAHDHIHDRNHYRDNDRDDHDNDHDNDHAPPLSRRGRSTTAPPLSGSSLAFNPFRRWGRDRSWDQQRDIRPHAKGRSRSRAEPESDTDADVGRSRSSHRRHRYAIPEEDELPRPPRRRHLDQDTSHSPSLRRYDDEIPRSLRHHLGDDDADNDADDADLRRSRYRSGDPLIATGPSRHRRHADLPRHFEEDGDDRRDDSGRPRRARRDDSVHSARSSSRAHRFDHNGIPSPRQRYQNGSNTNNNDDRDNDIAVVPLPLRHRRRGLRDDDHVDGPSSPRQRREEDSDYDDDVTKVPPRRRRRTRDDSRDGIRDNARDRRYGTSSPRQGYHDRHGREAASPPRRRLTRSQSRGVDNRGRTRDRSPLTASPNRQRRGQSEPAPKPKDRMETLKSAARHLAWGAGIQAGVQALAEALGGGGSPDKMDFAKIASAMATGIVVDSIVKNKKPEKMGSTRHVMAKQGVNTVLAHAATRLAGKAM